MRRVEAPDGYWAQVISSALADDYRYAVTPIKSDSSTVALIEFRLVD